VSSDQLSVISYQLSVISDQLSVISYQLSVISSVRSDRSTTIRNVFQIRENDMPELVIKFIAKLSTYH
jgi:hypothetical protein